MNIAVYCGSSDGNRKNYLGDAAALGKWIGGHGHTLVYGGSQGGLMGAAADAVLASGGKVIGVQPNVPLIKARRHPGVTEYIETETMAERKSVMIARADAFVALPGGLGTLDEITEILSLQSLKIVDAPIVFVNTEGYYEPVKAMIDTILQSEFGRKEYFEKVLFSDDIGEIGEFLENW